jgi:hypothetical protein
MFMHVQGVVAYFVMCCCCDMSVLVMFVSLCDVDALIMFSCSVCTVAWLFSCCHGEHVCCLLFVVVCVCRSACSVRF